MAKAPQSADSSSAPHSSSTIMTITIAVAAVLVVLVWPLSMIGKGDTRADASQDAELRIAPVARVEMQKAVAKTDGKPRDGETIYNTVCTACHAAGLAGAPKTGDKAAWAPRIATGVAALLKSATNGKNAMPARGGAADLSDAELKAAVEYLVGKAK
jgi:cytochrome c5